MVSVALVEDDAVGAFVFKKMVSGKANVRHFFSAELLLASGDLNRFAAIFVDVYLGPGAMDGKALAASLRADSAAFQGKLIAVTGLALDMERSELEAVGFDAVLVKPVQQAQVIQWLNVV